MIWDETLFAGAANFYARGRLPYAPGLPSALADLLGLAFSQDVLRLLRETSPSGRFAERRPSTEDFVWRAESL